MSAATLAALVLTTNVSADETVKMAEASQANTTEVQPKAMANEFVTMNSIQFDNPAFNSGILQIKQGETVTANATLSYTGPSYLLASDIALHILRGHEFISFSAITVDGINHQIHFSVTVAIPEDYTPGMTGYSIDVWDADPANNMVIERYSITNEIEVQENESELPTPDPEPDPETTPDPTPDPDENTDPVETPDTNPESPTVDEPDATPGVDPVPSPAPGKPNVETNPSGDKQSNTVNIPKETVKVDPVVKPAETKDKPKAENKTEEKKDVLPETGDDDILSIGGTILGSMMIAAAGVLARKRF
jgi:Predicted membrane protein